MMRDPLKYNLDAGESDQKIEDRSIRSGTDALHPVRANAFFFKITMLALTGLSCLNRTCSPSNFAAVRLGPIDGGCHRQQERWAPGRCRHLQTRTAWRGYALVS